MICVSWNINSLRLRLDQVEALILQEKPDILLLQETKVQDHQFPESFFHQLRYNVCFWGQKSYNGVAIASRFPLEDVVRRSFQDGSLCQGEARYIEAFTGGCRVACVYVPNGQAVGHAAYEKKRLFFQGLRTHLYPFIDREEPVLVAGDFNVALSDADVADPQHWRGHILYSLPERQWMRRLLHDGWGDSLPPASADTKNPFTWWDYRGRKWENNVGLRIDYFLLSPRALDTLQQTTVLEHWRGGPTPSDHAPVMVRLVLPNG